MVFSVTVMVSPHDYDNIKLMYYWYAISCILIAAWLVKLASEYKQRLLVVLLVLACTASGLLSLQRERLIRWRSFTQDELAAAAFVRDNTDARALFLTAPIHNQPILCLAGRPILLGYRAWIWTHGYKNFEQRETDLKAIYAGSNNPIERLEHYGVDYIYMSWSEKNDLKADVAFFERNFRTVFRQGEITIYDARSRPARVSAR